MEQRDRLNGWPYRWPAEARPVAEDPINWQDRRLRNNMHLASQRLVARIDREKSHRRGIA